MHLTVISNSVQLHAWFTGAVFHTVKFLLIFHKLANLTSLQSPFCLLIGVKCYSTRQQFLKLRL